MKRTLSSSATFFLKFIFSAIFIAAAGLLLFIFFFWPIITHERFIWPAAIFAIIWSGIAVSCCYLVTMPLKKVNVDDRTLYVSNYINEIAIPLSEIDRVEELYEFRFKPILIHLKSPTLFGQKIKFMPHTEFKWWWKEHSVIGELKEMAEEQH